MARRVKPNQPVDVIEEEKVDKKEDAKISEVVEEEEEVVEEEVEKVSEDALTTLSDVKDRFVGIVDEARVNGIATVTSRGFAALESFFGALAGDKEDKRPKR